VFKVVTDAKCLVHFTPNCLRQSQDISWFSPSKCSHYSPSINEFDPLSAIHLWNSSSTRGRRMNQQPYDERELEEEEELSEYSGSHLYI
jgi:hypothetical protein